VNQWNSLHSFGDCRLTLWCEVGWGQNPLILRVLPDTGLFTEVGIIGCVRLKSL
jgi:hypothetical protein